MGRTRVAEGPEIIAAPVALRLRDTTNRQIITQHGPTSLLRCDDADLGLPAVDRIDQLD